MRRSLTSVPLLLVAFSVVAQAKSCDARARALSLFKRAGLNLLQPARDYIAPGGLIVVANGKPEYDDPYDPVAPEVGTLTDFRAVVLQETETHATGFASALALAKSILPFSIDLRGTSEVTLQQIETSGVRLQTDAVDALIEKARTREAAKKALSQGWRVFVVQEIYKATSLNLQAASNKAFDVTYNDRSALAKCKEAALKGEGKSPSPSPKPSGGSLASPKEMQTTTVTAPDAMKTPAASPAAGESKAAELASPKPASGGLGACRSGQFDLTLTTSQPIPFAVRLVELERKGDGVQRKRGGMLSTTLGVQEIGGSVISDASPTLNNLQRRARSR